MTAVRAFSLVLQCLCTATFLLAPQARSLRAPPLPLAKRQSPTPVIIDTDIGSYIDDSYALAFALQSSELDIQLIVTATDDTLMRAKIAAKFLTIAGRDDIPIGVGAPNSNLTNHTLWSWAKDFNLSDYKGEVLQNYEDTFDRMNSIINSSDQVVEIIGLAPFVNFPYLLEKWPNVVHNARVRTMAGSIFRGYDNSTTPTAEYNVRLCPSCFNLLLRANWAYKVWLTPLDTSGVMNLPPEDVQELVTASNGLTIGLTEHTLFWCTAGVIPCHLDVATVALSDTVAVLLTLPVAPSLVEMQNMTLLATEDGHTIIDTMGAAALVALNWWDNPAGLNKFTQYLTDVLVQGAPYTKD
jgi:pyrimidine-specific ribonucleoside hydrolase